MDHVDSRKYHVEIDGIRYPKEFVDIKHGTNDYLDQDRDPNLFYEDYAKEPLINSFLTYTDMKQFYPIPVIVLKFQVNRVNPKKIQIFEILEETLIKPILILETKL